MSTTRRGGLIPAVLCTSLVTAVILADDLLTPFKRPVSDIPADHLMASIEGQYRVAGTRWAIMRGESSDLLSLFADHHDVAEVSAITTTCELRFPQAKWHSEDDWDPIRERSIRSCVSAELRRQRMLR